MTFEFDRDTRLTARGPGSGAGTGTYDADLAPGWVVGGGVNGGYLLAIIGRAVQNELAATGHRDPFSVSAHYLSASVPGPAYVETRVVRTGGRFSTVAATLYQDVDGVPVARIASHATYGDLDRAHDERSDLEAAALGLALPPPDLPPLEECVLSSDAPAEIKKIAPLLDRFGTRLDPATAMWAVGKPSRRGVIQGWFKLADDRPLDPIALLLVVDALPPVTFDLGMPGWAPTLELTAHVRARPAPGWAAVRHQTRTVAGGLFEEDCEVWDSTGRLVAQSRQLALQPRG
ncbi:thioesterase family protein [Marmoricola sp. RAF53]|uniref:thioesterase family protein n=1 Tax=Marmoricola sp. RAF53 TaxID=3233059 RepID=UPI003F99AB67